jgi:hypothetical protein
MLLGIKRVVTKMTMGDEFGIYRENEDKHTYLIFATTTYKEAMRYGQGVAKTLSVPFDSWLDNPDCEEDETAAPDKPAYLDGMGSKEAKATRVAQKVNPNARPKPKRVQGVAKVVIPMVAEGKTDEDIFQALLPKYLEAGRTETEARELIFAYVKDFRTHGK